MAEKIDIAIVARIDQFRKEMGKIPGVTKTETVTATKHMLKMWQDSETAARKAMDTSAKTATKGFDDIKKGATVAFGGIVGDIEDVSAALIAMGPAGVAVAAAAATFLGAAGLAYAAGYTASELISLTNATRENLDALKDYQSVSGLQVANFAAARAEAARLDDAWRALSLATTRVSAEIGTELVPAMQGVAVGAVAVVLAGSDMVKWLVDAGRYVVQFRDGLSDVQKVLFDLGVGSVVRDFQRLTEIGNGSNVATGGYLERANELVGSIGEIRRVTEVLGPVTDASIRRANAVADAHKRQAEEAKKAAAEAARLAEARAKAAALEREFNDETEDALDDLLAKNAEGIASAQRKSDAAHKRRLEQIATEQAARVDTAYSYVDTMVGIAQDIAQATADGAEEGSDAQKKAAMIAFRASQLAAAGEIIMNTATAATKAMAMFGPPPSPAGIAALGAVAVIGGIQGGIVAAQSPPQFHSGGMAATGGTPSGTGGTAPDERLVSVRRDEEIRTRDQQGGDMLRVEFVVKHRHQEFGRFIKDHIRLQGPLKRALDGRRSPGRRG